MTALETTYKRLFRSRRDRVIGGVCGGAGEYFGLDTTLIRVLWLVSVLIGGTGLLAYLIAWIIIPENPYHDPKPESERRRIGDPGKVLGIVLVIIALIWIGNSYSYPFLHWVPWHLIWPIALIVVGVALVLRPSIQRASDQYTTDMADSGEARETYDRSERSDAPAGDPLKRSRTDRILFGVCGGIANRYHVDPTLIRLGWALATIMSLSVFAIIYLVAALVLPEE